MSDAGTTDPRVLDRYGDLDEEVAEALIARYIKQDRNRRGRPEAWIDGGQGGPQVWVIINYLRGGFGVADAAHDYDLPKDAVRAAVAYYERHRDLIDAKLLLEREVDGVLEPSVT